MIRTDDRNVMLAAFASWDSAPCSAGHLDHDLGSFNRLTLNQLRVSGGRDGQKVMYVPLCAFFHNFMRELNVPRSPPAYLPTASDAA